MPRPVLITQCLQRDFVGPLAAHAALPNRLHVGAAEAERLLGRDPTRGPLAQLMGWVRAQPDDALPVFHIVDWHRPGEARQERHFARFGRHCVAESEGAALVEGLAGGPGQRVHAVDLNDVHETELASLLEAERARSPDGLLRVAVIGVWTEAKVTFLLYDLKTRLGIDELATCSALTASASRAQHFNALSQLQKILGVRVFDSVGDLAGWLRPEAAALAPAPLDRGYAPELSGTGLPEGTDRKLAELLYRDAAEVELHPLGGGFSGASVYRAGSRDALGHQQAPSVLKLGSRRALAQERAAFEQVEAVLGNYAPRVHGFVEHGERAALRYAYAAMGQDRVQPFKSLYMEGAGDAVVERVLDTVFERILGRFYQVARYERLDLLEHYGFAPRWAGSVERKVAGLVGEEAARGDEIEILGQRVRNPARFYDRFLTSAAATGRAPELHYMSYVHGDLNGANMLIDDRLNVWVIDWFHTARAHVLKDIAKLENDLLYIFTPLEDEDALREAMKITDALRSVRDLRAPLPDLELERPALARAWRVVQLLRRHAARLVREDRDPAQLAVAGLRYAAHTLGFDESSPLQRRWALYAAGGHAEDAERFYRKTRRLWVNWIPAGHFEAGRVGLTICPGRRDRDRDLGADLAALREDGATDLVSLLTPADLAWAGVPRLPAAARENGLHHDGLSIPDQQVPGFAEATALVDRIWLRLGEGARIVLHCMGGLGRSGTIAALLLVRAGLEPDAAIQVVRAARDPRAVETTQQERFVHDCAARWSAT